MLSRIIFVVSVFRSYIFCLRHFPLEQAKLCPVLLHWRTKVYVSNEAKLIIDNPQKFGIRIGVWGVVMQKQTEEHVFSCLTNR